METVQKINQFVNSIVWGPFMLCVFVGVGILYTVKLKFFQIRNFSFWWKNTFVSMLHTSEKNTSERGISPFQAMSTALAGAVGTGNIAGVAGAITLGGAGAIFWMWMAAIFGMASIYAENYLGITFREKQNGKYIGGPMYYIEKGLELKPLAIIFAFICTCAALGMGNMTQANSVAGSIYNGFGIPCQYSAIVISVLTAFIIIGGIKRISAITEKVMPVITVIYILVALIVIFININSLPSAIEKIFVSAFDIKAAAGGFMGYGMTQAIRYGISRGVFSNEAGLGTSPIVHAAAETDDPSIQGMWGIFQVFIDTIVLCTLMALCIIMTGADSISDDGIEVSTFAFESSLGAAGKVFLSVSIIIFAFATLISWCYYGESSLSYLTGGKYIIPYRIIYSAAAYIGCIMNASLVWEISDTLNGLMAIPNLTALIMLSRFIKRPDIDKKIS